METEKRRAKFTPQMPDMPEQQEPTKEGAEPKDDFMPEIRVECTNLPSAGVPYPKGAFIKHRPYMFGEVKKVSQSKLDHKNSYEYILKGVQCSFDKMKLTVADVMYIGLLRKLSTLGGTEIIARYHCEKCQKPGQIIFKTDSLEFDDLQVKKLPIVVDFSFGTVHFQPATIKQYFELCDKNKAEDEIALYAIQAINMKFDEAYERFYNLNPEDVQLLLEVDKLLYHSLRPIYKKCTNALDDKSPCGANIKIELDGGQALLLPFRREQGVTKAKIRFGLEDER